MLSGRSEFGGVLKRRISINITVKSIKTSWGLTFMIMELEIMTQQLEDG